MSMHVIFIRRAIEPRHGVLYYAKVRSRSMPMRLHDVAITKRGGRCGCEDNVFRRKCDHVTEVRARLKKRGGLGE